LFYLYLEGIKKGWNVYPRRANTSGVCYQEDYYEVPKNNHPPTIVLENSEEGYFETNVFGVNESIYPEIRNKFINGDKLTIDDYTFLADFIIQLKLRNPIWKSFLDSTVHHWSERLVAAIIMKDLPPEMGRISEPVRQYVTEMMVQNFKADPELANKARLFSLNERAKADNPNNARIREALLNSCWTMIDVSTTAQVNFITSDNPGYSLTKAGRVINIKFAGEFTFMLPLTSKHCLKISDKGNPSQKPAQGYLTLNRKGISDVDTVLFNYASSQVINKLVLAERGNELSFLQNLLKMASEQG